MNKMLSRFLSLVLCLVMALGMIPAAAAAEVEVAEETIAVTEETIAATEEVAVVTEETMVTVEETEAAEEAAAETEPSGIKEIVEEVEMIVRDEAGMSINQYAEDVYSFTSFADLKQLLSFGFSDYTYVFYENTDPLVITENITIPDYVTVDGWAIYIPNGVTVNVQEGGSLSAGLLDVYGTLNAYSVYAEDKLNVAGTINCTGSIYVDIDCAVSGLENVQFNGWADRLWMIRYVDDMASLKYAVERAQAVQSENYFVEIYNNNKVPIVISESLTMPWNVRLYVNSQMTVAPGVTLHLDNAVPMIYAPLVVQGTLINDHVMNIYPEYGGKLVIENGGSYSGSGAFSVWGQNLADPWGAFSNLDVSGYKVEYSADEYGKGWFLEYQEGCVNHVMGEWYSTVAPTCTAGGTERRDCVNCTAYFETRDVAALGHSFGEWYQTQAPSCSTDGAQRRDCANGCGGYETKVVPPLGHTYGEQDVTCHTCGATRNLYDRETMNMYRMYDPNGHEHFYTGSEVERDDLVAAGWNYEGVGFTFPLTTGGPVHRLYDENNTKEHLYTMDEAEKNRLISEGWNYEGVAFNSAFEDEVPQYRLHNPNETRGAYHFTASIEERDYLISLGWEYQGIGWYSCWK